MKKEAVNSFAKGMIQDMSEMTTSADCYTDCLNGTLLTNNGNEMSLQNDIGNVKLDDVKLSDGFVPVGVKEFGGIIYIASYNPESKKSEIGCFPSPQQKFGQDESSNNIIINIDKFLKFEDGLLIIYNDVEKQALFVTDLQPKIFHQGDKFLLKAGIIPEKVAELISKGYLTIDLGVLNKNGQIEHMDTSYLTKYTETNNTILQPSDTDEWHIFKHKTSGGLVLILRYKIYNNFLLLRLYSTNEDGVLQVSFYGKSDNADVDILGKLGTKSGTKRKVNPVKTLTVTKTDSSTLSYEIYPYSEYGLHSSLMKSGSINWDNILKNKSSLHKWRYYIHDSEILLDWSFDYFNLSMQQIDCLQFSFIDLQHLEFAAGKGSKYKSLSYKYRTVKEYYSGDFTEYLPFTESGLLKNKVYLCTVSTITRPNGEDIIDPIIHLLIYTGTYFNYVSDKEFETLRTDVNNTNRPKITIPVIQDINVKHQVKKEIIKANLNKAHDALTNNLESDTREYNLKEINQLSWKHYSVTHPEEDNRYRFISEVSNEYEMVSKLESYFPDTVNVTIEGNTVALNISEAFVDLLPTDFILHKSVEFTYKAQDTEEQFEGSGTFVPKASCDVKDDTVTITRGVWASSGDIKTKTMQMERLMPVYDTSKYANYLESSNLFGFDVSKSGNITAISGDKDYICYGSQFIQGESRTEGDHKGTQTAGTGDVALSLACREMGGTINMLGGHDGDAASLALDGDKDNERIEIATFDAREWETGRSGYGWWHSTLRADEIDGGDNFLIACWKTAWDRSKYALINLASPKVDHSPLKRKRLDVMLKCILSLLLVAKVIEGDVTYTSPSFNTCQYHKSYDNELLVTAEVTYGKGKYVTTWDTITTNLGRVLKTNFNKEGTVVNYIPEVTFSREDTLVKQIYIGSDIDLDKVIQFYKTSYNGPSKADSEYTLNTDKRKGIYRGKVTRIDLFGVCTLSGDPIKGGYEIHDMDNPSLDYAEKDKIYFYPLVQSQDTDELEFVLDTAHTSKPILLLPLRYPINRMFITKANIDHLYDNLTINFYNEVLLNEDSSSRLGRSRWEGGGTSRGPNFYIDYEFGPLRIANWEDN